MHRPTTAALLMVALMVGMAAGQPPDPTNPLTDEIRSLMADEYHPSLAAQHQKILEEINRRIGQLSPDQRPSWEMKVFSVLGLPLSPPDTTRLDDQGTPAESAAAAQPRELKPDELANVIDYYQALLADADPTVISLAVKCHLGDALAMQSAKLPRAERGDSGQRAVGVLREAADQAETSGHQTLAALATGRLAMTMFLINQREQAAALRPQAIRLYEALPDRYLVPIVREGDEAVWEPTDRERLGHARWYETHANVYLLHALSEHNRQLAESDPQHHWIFPMAESLRVALAYRYITGISNVSALLIRPGIGESTGRASKIQGLRDGLKALTSAQSNPHWQGRGRLAEVDEAFRWIHARVGGAIGEYYADTGQLLRARYQFNQAASSAAELNDQAILPYIQRQQIQLLGRAGLVSAALREAREYALGTMPKSEKARLLMTMASVARSEGDYDRAADFLAWASDLFIGYRQFTLDKAELRELSRIRAAMAELQVEQGRAAEALSKYREAVSFLQLTSPEEAFDIATDRERLRRTLKSSKRYRPSPGVFAALEATPQNVLLAVTPSRGPGGTVNISDWERRMPSAGEERTVPTGLSRRQATRIRQHFGHRQESREQVVDDTDVTDIWPLLSSSARTSERSGRRQLLANELEEAAQSLQSALDVNWETYSNHIDPTLGIESLDAVHRLHHDAALVQVRLGYPDRALAILDMARDRSLIEASRQGQDLWETMNDDERQQARVLDERRTQANQLVTALAQNRRLQSQLQEARKQLLKAEADWSEFLSRAASSYRVPLPPEKPLSTPDLKGLLDEGSSLLMYSAGAFETLVVAAHRRGEEVTFNAWEIPILRDELASLVDALQQGCSVPGMPYALLAKELGTLLVPWEELEDARLLVVAPDGILNDLVFGVLQNASGKTLTQRFPLARITSLRLLERLRAQGAEVGQGTLLVDLQDFEGRSWLPSFYQTQLDARSLNELLPRFHLEPTPFTRDEVDRLQELLGADSQRLSGPAAQEAKFIEALSGRRYVHIATHGLVDPYSPFQSVLVLAEPLPGSVGDGYLEAAEIRAAGDFRGVELVTLSTCESGLGLVQGTEGVLGLTWSLLAAGSRSVLSSWWKVEDEATAEFMYQFYRGLQAGQGKAESLRGAAQHIRQQDGWSHPYYWAPFQLIGDWQMAGAER